jgi:hypothetical protein
MGDEGPYHRRGLEFLKHKSGWASGILKIDGCHKFFFCLSCNKWLTFNGQYENIEGNLRLHKRERVRSDLTVSMAQLNCMVSVFAGLLDVKASLRQITSPHFQQVFLDNASKRLSPLDAFGGRQPMST